MIGPGGPGNAGGLRRWFSTQPIHRKLVLTSMAKTTTVLLVAMLILLALDSWRFQGAAQVDVDTLASMTADNIRAALAFDDGPALAASLGVLRMRPQVRVACDTGKTVSSCRLSLATRTFRVRAGGLNRRRASCSVHSHLFSRTSTSSAPSTWSATGRHFRAGC